MRTPSFLRLLKPIPVIATLLCATPAFAEDVPVSDEARTHFDTGVSYLEDPDGARYEEAYREFKKAYELSPSWKILSNLGIAALKLERDGEAIEAFQRYLREGGTAVDADERAQVERDMKMLEASAATLTLESVPEGAVVTDERRPVSGSPIVNRYGPVTGKLVLRVRPGLHRLSARVDGYADASVELDVQPGSVQAHTFQLERASAGEPTPDAATPPGQAQETERPVPVGVYIGLAATGAFAIGAGVTGVLALGKKSDYEDANDGTDPATAKDLRDSGQTLNLVTDVLMGAAVVSGAVTAVLYLTRPEKPPEQDRSALRLLPAVSTSGVGLAVARSF